MKRNEVIELNGEEYTLELNRESFLQIDRICNIQDSMKIINRGLYDYIEDIDDNYNPLQDFENLSDDKLKEEVDLKEKTLKKIVERSFFIWLYPNHKLPISKVSELLKPYFEDEKKAEWIGEKLGEYLNTCVSIKEEYDKEQKNLKAQANK